MVAGRLWTDNGSLHRRCQVGDAEGMVTGGAFALPNMVLELLRPELQRPAHRPGDGIAEGAQRLAFDVVAEVHKQRNVFRPSGAVDDPAERLVHPGAAFAAGRTLAAA